MAGLVGAGGNAGAVAAGFLLKATSGAGPRGLLMLGIIVAVVAVLAPLIRFSEADEFAVRAEILDATMLQPSQLATEAV